MRYRLRTLLIVITFGAALLGAWRVSLGLGALMTVVIPLIGLPSVIRTRAVAARLKAAGKEQTQVGSALAFLASSALISGALISGVVALALLLLSALGLYCLSSPPPSAPTWGPLGGPSNRAEFLRMLRTVLVSLPLGALLLFLSWWLAWRKWPRVGTKECL